jgi:hypothetical protein
MKEIAQMCLKTQHEAENVTILIVDRPLKIIISEKIFECQAITA